MARKPWETPIEYDEPSVDSVDDGDEPDYAEPTPRRSRASGRDRNFVSTDTTPIDYSRGPHDDEFGVADNDER
jgi:hypothetical protein